MSGMAGNGASDTTGAVRLPLRRSRWAAERCGCRTRERSRARPAQHRRRRPTRAAARAPARVPALTPRSAGRACRDLRTSPQSEKSDGRDRELDEGVLGDQPCGERQGADDCHGEAVDECHARPSGKGGPSGVDVPSQDRDRSAGNLLMRDLEESETQGDEQDQSHRCALAQHTEHRASAIPETGPENRPTNRLPRSAPPANESGTATMTAQAAADQVLWIARMRICATRTPTTQRAGNATSGRSASERSTRLTLIVEAGCASLSRGRANPRREWTNPVDTVRNDIVARGRSRGALNGQLRCR